MSEKKISSGAEKAEKLAGKASRKTAGARKSGAKKSAAVQHSTEMQEKKSEQIKLEPREERKLAAAKLKAEKEQKRLEKKLEHKQKAEERAAALKDRREERREKRLARREAARSRTREQRAEEKKQARIAKAEATKARREARLNAKIAKREHDLKVKAEKRKEKKDRTPGFGGWLAAVIALGVSTLTLGTMLTFGWINMNGMQADMVSDASHSLYELNAIVDNLDANLAKARIAASSGDRARVLADIAIESEMAESAIERLPVSGDMTRSMTSFINRMGESAQGMLYTISDGGELTSSQKATIEYMYECNAKIKEFLNSITGDFSEKDMLEALKGKGMIFDEFEGYVDPATEVPKEIYDGPFAENAHSSSAKGLEGAEEITPEKAQELCNEWFKDYGIEESDCTGEAAAEMLTVYNVRMTTKDGDEYFAQVSKQGGRLVLFDSYKACTDNNFSVENCKDIAENFLSAAGYKNMVCVWESEDGTTCNLNYVFEEGGAAVYPDMVKIKVCEERGMVTGIEALPYVLNHTQRSIPSPALTKAQAEAKLGGMLEVESSRLAIIPKEGGEVLAYEFCGTYGGRTYYVYLDADTGREVDVFTVVGSQVL